ncbi:chromate transporter [Monaibacterium marinum]|uniref:Chromate transporter n=1 Tax=Pontivivens marinum TaxID=1690039 RepID=A0A2C9CPZ4_9RHOB|nr:chromate efflux transporter [Monaibacterium marinum]SOH93404.1 chromate transporter [Monaibacterium marinum]
MSTVKLSQALGVYLRIGLLSFGGPAGQIALMQEELVTRRGWIDAAAFQRGLNVAMLLPGPEAQQLATWLGWRLHGIWGGLAAGLAFILPGTALMIALAWIAATKGDSGPVAALFYGIQPAVLVIVAKAVMSLSGRSLKGARHWALAALAFGALAILGLSFPIVMLVAALAGFLLPPVPQPDIPATPPARGSTARIIVVSILAVALVYWAVRLCFGVDPFDGVAELFLSAAFVSFGGAYALLPYVAERAVDSYGWLSPEQMLNGLAIAEATPGPLILVNVYAGFFAGHSATGFGVLTAALACFYTFAPSFMLILAAAPHVESIQRRRWIRQALAGVSAAVVGVVLNLAFYLAQAALWPDFIGQPDWLKLALVVVFALMTWRLKPSVLVLIGSGAAIGLALHLGGAI